MSDKNEAKVSDRRAFLKLAGLGVASGGAALASAVKPAEAVAPEADRDALYRETEHVKTYYKLARF